MQGTMKNAGKPNKSKLTGASAGTKSAVTGESSDFNYKKAAAYAIRQLGGKEEVKKRIMISEKYFSEIALRDFVKQRWPEPPSCNTAILHQHIVSILKISGKPDMAAQLKELKESLQAAENQVDNMLFYYM
jgi:hypothetical protein